MLFGFALLVTWASHVAGWEHIKDGDALKQAVNQAGDTLVAFTVQTPKSNSLEAEWLSAAKEGKETTLVSIDCVAHKSICDSYGVTSYPSVVLFRSGLLVASYMGQRRASAILQWAARWKTPLVTELSTVEDLETFKSADDVAFVAFLDSKQGDSAAAFSRMAQKYRDEFRFGIVTDESIAMSQDLNVPAVVCYRSIDGDILTGSDFESDKLEAWIKESSRQVLGDLTIWNRQRLLDRGWPMVYLFAQTQNEREELRQTILKFAKNYYDSLTSVMVDPLEFPELMGKLGLEEGRFPAGAVHQLSKDRIYPFPTDKPLTPSTIQKWGLDVYQGRIKPWTPPGVTTTFEDLKPTKAATRKISIRSYPGMKIKIAGHEEL
ncbi:Thioredoxin-like domain containing protein [Rhypophila sp. PSN 637]